MQLIFERSRSGRSCSILPACDVEKTALPEAMRRAFAPRLPMVSEIDLSRHYSELEKHIHGVNDGFYPLGSCTMKYNPQINEEIAALAGFTGVHPLQPSDTVQGSLEVLAATKAILCEITGMDDMTFQPAAGAHGELTGMLMIKAYHQSKGQSKRNKIIVPDTAHGTNPASAAMAGFTVISIASNAKGCVDLDLLRQAVGPDTAGLMLTNPNTVGIFDENILEITKIIHEAGGLNYYDGANLNAIMGIVRPGEMGFDVIHLNLHKSFATPHGGGGPGSGPVGCKAFLAPFLPLNNPAIAADGTYCLSQPEQSIGSVRTFYGNFLVVVKALTYLLTLGAEGIPEVAANAVLNANYLRVLLSEKYEIAFNGICMHEFVISLARLHQQNGVSAMDIAKAILDNGMHPPTMYFPMIVQEALMVEPTETEAKETLDAAAAIYLAIYEEALANPQSLHDAPITTPVGRLDEVGAARNPRVRYQF
ncbi:MAG: aminomethyl-transferring glycine dehydrogenase subunit GcvPB [Negativicutes bacterium]|nr:aminomethyl-transferring glycine dehydrogenase subunit GcvPB [Negativicutes bacterium]